MGWLQKKRNNSAINYRMRLAARLGGANTAANLDYFITEVAPTQGADYTGPRTWDDFIGLATKMDNKPLDEGRASGYKATEADLTTTATWLLGENGVVKSIRFDEFKYCWED